MGFSKWSVALCVFLAGVVNVELAQASSAKVDMVALSADSLLRGDGVAEREPVLIAGRPAATGKASWYGPGFNGRRTANGEIYNQNALTAAHPSYPFGCKVRVTHLGNGRQVTLRVNDRGPFVGGRIIDLSYEGARQLGMVEQGVASVRVEPLSC